MAHVAPVQKWARFPQMANFVGARLFLAHEFSPRGVAYYSSPLLTQT